MDPEIKRDIDQYVSDETKKIRTTKQLREKYNSLVDEEEPLAEYGKALLESLASSIDFYCRENGLPVEIYGCDEEGRTFYKKWAEEA